MDLTGKELTRIARYYDTATDMLWLVNMDTKKVIRPITADSWNRWPDSLKQNLPLVVDLINLWNDL